MSGWVRGTNCCYLVIGVIHCACVCVCVCVCVCGESSLPACTTASNLQTALQDRPRRQRKCLMSLTHRHSAQTHACTHWLLRREKNIFLGVFQRRMSGATANARSVVVNVGSQAPILVQLPMHQSHCPPPLPASNILTKSCAPFTMQLPAQMQAECEFTYL